MKERKWVNEVHCSQCSRLVAFTTKDYPFEIHKSFLLMCNQCYRKLMRKLDKIKKVIEE